MLPDVAGRQSVTPAVDTVIVGADPDGFMPKGEIVDHLVGSLEPGEHGGFLLRTSSGEIRAKHVVLASGGYQKAHRPGAAAQLPAAVHAIDAEDYTNPTALSPGKVLIVGSGQTGCQLPEEILEAGRDVSLSCGAPEMAPPFSAQAKVGYLPRRG